MKSSERLSLERMQTKIEIACQPERRQPNAKKNMKDSDYDDSTDCHPFWHIRRSNVVGEFNSAVVDVLVKMITSAPNEELKIAENTPKESMPAFQVWVPHIVNTEDIAAGEEIVVKFDMPEAKRDPPCRKRVISAFSMNGPKRVKETGWGTRFHLHTLRST